MEDNMGLARTADDNLREMREGSWDKKHDRAQAMMYPGYGYGIGRINSMLMAGNQIFGIANHIMGIKAQKSVLIYNQNHEKREAEQHELDKEFRRKKEEQILEDMKQQVRAEAAKAEAAEKRAEAEKFKLANAKLENAERQMKFKENAKKLGLTEEQAMSMLTMLIGVGETTDNSEESEEED